MQTSELTARFPVTKVVKQPQTITFQTQSFTHHSWHEVSPQEKKKLVCTKHIYCCSSIYFICKKYIQCTATVFERGSNVCLSECVQKCSAIALLHGIMKKCYFQQWQAYCALPIMPLAPSTDWGNTDSVNKNSNNAGKQNDCDKSTVANNSNYSSVRAAG